MMRVMFNYGIGKDLMAFNPAAEIEVIGRRDEKKPVIPPDKEVMRELIELADGDFALLLGFAAATGVRAGELYAVRWKHISFTRHEVRIETRVDAYRDEDVPKSVAGIRTIPLAESLLLSLKEWKLHTSFSQPDDLVFPNLSATTSITTTS
jgi:integrase